MLTASAGDKSDRLVSGQTSRDASLAALRAAIQSNPVQDVKEHTELIPYVRHVLCPPCDSVITKTVYVSAVSTVDHSPSGEVAYLPILHTRLPLQLVALCRRCGRTASQPPLTSAGMEDRAVDDMCK